MATLARAHHGESFRMMNSHRELWADGYPGGWRYESKMEVFDLKSRSTEGVIPLSYRRLLSSSAVRLPLTYLGRLNSRQLQYLESSHIRLLRPIMWKIEAYSRCLIWRRNGVLNTIMSAELGASSWLPLESGTISSALIIRRHRIMLQKKWVLPFDIIWLFPADGLAATLRCTYP